MKSLDCFAGIGGITKALEPWATPVAYCEKDPYAQGVIRTLIKKGELHAAPIWDDIETLDGRLLKGSVDLIAGGFPCTDLSVAGRAAGLEGKHSGLFFQVCRLVEEIQPAFVFLENVPAIRTRGLQTVIDALTDLRYDCRWTCVSAKEVGAGHVRKRWFLLANSHSSRLEGQRTFAIGAGKKFGDACDHSWREDKSSVERAIDELPFRLDRLRCIGNAVVSAQVSKAFKRLIGI